MEAVQLAPSTSTGPLPDLLAEVPAWYADARCSGADPEAFFPEKGESNTAAKALCADCPVVADCLAYALALEDGDRLSTVGVWGGTSPGERKRLRRAQGAAS